MNLSGDTKLSAGLSYFTGTRVNWLDDAMDEEVRPVHRGKPNELFFFGKYLAVGYVAEKEGTTSYTCNLYMYRAIQLVNFRLIQRCNIIRLAKKDVCVVLYHSMNQKNPKTHIFSDSIDTEKPYYSFSRFSEWWF